MKKKIITFTALALMLSNQSEARDQIKIVGSSTVYPFATVVAERFGKTSGFKTPVIESTGSGGGLKLFCKGLGTQHPDITNASRRIKMKEVKNCEKNGVKDITEIKIGYDGIAIANAKSGPTFDLTLRDLYLALAKEIPADAEGDEVKANPFKMWNEINPKLPAKPIVVIGPPPTSGTRDAFNELAIEKELSKRYKYEVERQKEIKETEKEITKQLELKIKLEIEKRKTMRESRELNINEEIIDQLKLEGRIIVVFKEKNLGQCRLGIKTKSGLQWRNLFEANCVLLNDFKLEKEFTLWIGRKFNEY